MRSILSSFTSCLLIACCMPAFALHLTPYPVHITRENGIFTLNKNTSIYLNTKDAEAVGRLLAKRLRLVTGYALPFTRYKKKNEIALQLSSKCSVAYPEGYLLSVEPAGIQIEAQKPAGLFYGIDTLYQLLPVSVMSSTAQHKTHWQVRCVRIADWPRFSWRGLMLDSARHLQSVQFIRQTIRRMAYYKLNTLHWHLSDGQGWRLQLNGYPALTSTGAWRIDNGKRYGGFYTESEVRELTAYAKARFIRIIPEIDMPAHCQALLASYPQLGCTSGPFHVLSLAPSEGTDDVIDPAKASTYQLLEGILTKLMRLFPSHILHIGGDECPVSQWQEAPDCLALMKRKGMTNPYQLENYFANKLAAFLQQNGWQMEGWNELLYTGPLPQGVIVQQWNSPDAAVQAIQQGHAVVSSLTHYAYFDYSYDTTTLGRVYRFNPMPAGLSPKQKKLLLGPEACLWTETKPTDSVADSFIWPRLLAIAEAGWTPQAEKNWKRFVKSLTASQYARLALMGVDAPRGVEELLADSNFTPHVTVAQWLPAQMSEKWETLTWNITASIHKSGRYRMHLTYTQGGDGIHIKSVELRQNGQRISIDQHAGWAGDVSHSNDYIINIPAYQPGEQYTLSVQLRCDGGVDSQGKLVMYGPDPAVKGETG